MSTHYLYLVINLATLFFPLILSFDKKVAFFKTWKYLFPSMLIASGIFILWDVWFTLIGVWEFNPKYITGIHLSALPIEEWLFFITIPYSCIFIYECIKQYFPSINFKRATLPIGILITLVLIVFGFFNLNKWYTSITFISAGLFTAIHLAIHGKEYYSKFLVMFAIQIIPFTIVNGILTAKPVVIYNNAENLDIRIGSIPIEDNVYGYLLLLMTMTFMELFRSNNRKYS